MCVYMKKKKKKIAPLQLELSRLFPDGQVALPLARHLFHPNDYLWDRITRLWGQYVTRMPNRVGIQVSTRHTDSASAPALTQR